MNPESLAQELARPLPGTSAHATMQPLSRGDRARRIPIERTRPAAVLILLVPGRPVTIPLIRRTHDGGPHAGQIALPGGSGEGHDETPEETALRETREEIGIHPDRCRVLGSLTPLYIDVSGFLITPVVAWYLGGTPPRFAPNPCEVERVIPVDPRTLGSTRTVQHLHVRGETIQTPVYYSGEDRIWGATAMILAEFDLIRARALHSSVISSSGGSTKSG